MVQPSPGGTKSRAGLAQAGQPRQSTRAAEDSRAGQSPRAAYARPRVLLSAMTALIAAGSWWAMAQKASVAPQPKASAASASSTAESAPPLPVSWENLPHLMAEYGQRRRAAALAGAKSGGKRALASTRRFALTEVDLTPGNRSDEREPAFRPQNGDYIAFSSNGVDANNDGILDSGSVAGRRYHIWILNRANNRVRRLTGFNTRAGGDASRDQRAPTWSPDGNRICYYDVINGSTTQLAIVPVDVNSTANPLPLQITFFPGRKLDPAWNPGGDAIAFASNTAPVNAGNSAVPAGGFDIFTLNPSGNLLTLRRLTGDADNRSGNTILPSDPQDLTGNSTDDRHPTYSQVQPGIIFFSSNRQSVVSSNGTTTTGSTVRLAAGRRIFAMSAANGQFKRQVTNPVARGGIAADEDDYPTASRAGSLPFGTGLSAFRERLGFQTNSRIDAQDSIRDRNVWSLPVSTSSIGVFLNNAAGTVTAFEGSSQAGGNVAQVESNLLSTSTATSLFVGATQDRAADEEPAFSRLSNSNNTSPDFPTVVFASQRSVAPAPNSSSSNPRPVVVNPGGGDSASSSHDLWTTTASDFTPPLLIPYGTGNQQSAFVAPGLQAPFYAPRTAEEGLGPGSKLIVAVVLQDRESGLNLATATSTATPAATAVATATPVGTPIVPVPAPTFGGNSVTVRIRSSESTFADFPTKPNEGISINAAVEQNPDFVTGDIPLAVFDDGPPSQGGHERQDGAIRGDGIYYAQASIDVSQVLGGQPQGDFVFDLNVTDRAGNAFTYDKVYGFSTEIFTRRANLLFVSDYTMGQRFPYELIGGRTVNRLNPVATGAVDLNLPPVESYHLSNPGGAAVDIAGTGNGSADLTTFSAPGETSFGAAPTSVDVYRVLSRGPVPENVLGSYRPNSTNQIDPNAAGFELVQNVVNPTATPVATPIATSTPGATPGGTVEPLPTVPVTVAERAIIWASPYSGDVLASPGSIADTETQRRLSNFLNVGGRMFLNGQDIIYALSLGGNRTNSFLQNELKANYQNGGSGGETAAGDVNNADSNYGFVISGNGNAGNRISNRGYDPPITLHVPFNPATPLDNTYFDASDNDTFADVISPVAAGDGESVVEVYAYGNGQGRAGQIIRRTGRAGGLESAVVFFGFGLEHVNREYTNNPPTALCRNFRAKIAENVVNDLRTGGITGQVRNRQTGLPIPNFLVQLTDTGFRTRYALVRTNLNGFYSFSGVPSRDGGYRVSPASQTLPSGRVRSLNPGYFFNPNVLPGQGVIGGQTNENNNFTVDPILPSTVVGRAISDRGTPDDLNDDSDPVVDIVPNLPVLIRSTNTGLAPSPSFPLGGTYAQLTQTDASGQFVFDNVPAELTVEIIFNPRPGLVSQGGDIPDRTGIDYDTSTALIRRNPNFGRRVIPTDNGYSGPRVPGIPATGDLIIPQGDTLTIGDVPVPPAGSGISGRVLRRLGSTDVSASAATVQLLLNGNIVQQVTANQLGQYTFTDIQPGTYTIRASLVVGTTNLTGSTSITVTVASRGTNIPASTIIVFPGGVNPNATPTPTVRPTATGAPTPTPTTNPANESYQPGQTYFISVPFADSAAPSAVTTVAKAFTLPPTSGTTTNYNLYRYNPLINDYVKLSAGSALRRGEGYFLRVLARAVSLRTPASDRTRFPTTASQFTITLRRNPSDRSRDGGFNFIGFPFNPAVYSSVVWAESTFIGPDGRVYPNLRAAAGAGLFRLLEQNENGLFTLEPGAADQTVTTTLIPYRGYFVQPLVDNVRVILKARR